MTDIVILKDSKSNPFYPKTHTSAVAGLNDRLSEYDNRMTNVELSNLVVNPLKWKGGNASAFGRKQYSDIYYDANKLNLNTLTIPLQISAVDASDSNPVITDYSYNEAWEAIPKAKRDGYRVILEPYPFIANGTIAETDWIPSDIEQWFSVWGQHLKNLAATCEENGVDGLYIASNLVHMESFTDKWEALISEVRTVYTGKILYRTNYWITASWAPDYVEAYENKLNNALFGLVDVIAIAAYFELTDNKSPSVDEFIDAIYSVPLYGRGQNIFDEIKAFHDKWDKPIFFGELGIPPYSNSPQQPHNAFGDLGEYNESIQSNWFEAWVRVFQTQEWWLGYSIYTIADEKSVYNVMGRKAETVIRGQSLGGQQYSMNEVINQLNELKKQLDELKNK
ncbi:glycoside hydrolase family 113 [Bacillus amyloliquefaciens]|uniref:glycoside hydrolase family 113 n=1 Tax=Bacillus amyloliquefaciens TaxID=1390 RepID=UPI002FF8C815